MLIFLQATAYNVKKNNYFCISFNVYKQVEMDYTENRKEELYSQSIPAGKRRYFFDVKETRGGDKFITIAESRKVFDNATGQFYIDKNKMFLYKEDFEKFKQGLENAFSFIETGIVPPPVVVEERHTDSINIDGSAPLDDMNLSY